MKKIMFSDKYGLTKAVLEGRKTMTRRTLTAIACNHIDWTAFKYGEMECYGDGEGGWYDIKCASRFQIGEVVAVAQSYKDILGEEYSDPALEDIICGLVTEDHPGCTNKMFARADLMPHKIRITDIKVERLQDISDEDCFKEGIMQSFDAFYYLRDQHFNTPKEAFANLIDKVSGKGTWERNPYVFVYEFELRKGRSEE